MLKIVYLVVSAATLGLLAFEAPSGSLLTSSPDRGKVKIGPEGKPAAGGTTVRGGPAFIWIGGGGGYRGGK